jgi:hypothetical protein
MKLKTISSRLLSFLSLSSGTRNNKFQSHILMTQTEELTLTVLKMSRRFKHPKFLLIVAWLLGCAGKQTEMSLPGL